MLPFLLILGGTRQDAGQEKADRLPRSPAVVPLTMRALPVAPAETDAVQFTGLWTLSAKEKRFGGLSALAVRSDRLIAISDSGVVLEWAKAGGRVRLADLPDGPGPPDRKLNRDSEALVADAAGTGWWVAFEQHHSVFHFDAGFRRTLGKRPVQFSTWWRNWGIEGISRLPSGDLLLLAENGDQVIELGAAGQRTVAMQAPGQIADAALLRDGRTLIALRQVRPWGLTNRLGWLERSGAGYRVAAWKRLPLARWDNVEGLAAEPLPNGATRIWFVTDNDFSRRTVLGTFIVPPASAKRD